MAEHSETPEDPSDSTRVAETADRPLADQLFEAETRRLRRPGSVYRLQLHAGFTFEDLSGVVPYLEQLGITDLYLSPHLEARPGSTHGYDVFDHTRLNPEIGTDEQYARLVAGLAERGMGRVLDIVPNHMGIGGFNRFWIDVLEIGPHAQSARFFDIDWSPVKEELAGRVLLPILEDQYGVVLENGLLRLQREEGEFAIAYHGHRLPLSPRSYALILGQREAEWAERFDPDDPEVMEFRSILDAARQLPLLIEMYRFPAERSRREKEVIKRRIRRLCAVRQDIRDFLDTNISLFQGEPGAPRSFDLMHALLEQQVYRLAFWRVAGEEINYRRFFDINDLAGLRTEDPHVFAAIHRLIFDWVARGGVSGLRIDHPDGLADPLGYFQRLQEELLLLACRNRLQAIGEPSEVWPTLAPQIRDRYRLALRQDPTSSVARRFPILAEKILSPGEALPTTWPIDGTVGYEFLNLLNGLFVDRSAARGIGRSYAGFTGDTAPFAEVVYRAKQLIARSSLASEINTLARRLNRISERDRRSRDFTLNDFRLAIRELIACFPVYRTYLRPDQPVSPRDRADIDRALREARRRNPQLDPSLFAYLRAILRFEAPGDPTPEMRSDRDSFVVKFQQTTGPIQAKGLEDTAFYRQVQLASLNEVGGDPTRFGVTPEQFHQACLERRLHWPDALTTTSTHDTKRGEDARIRIDALSEFADDWHQRLRRWSDLNASRRIERDGTSIPDPGEENLLYQALLGTWPFEGLTPENTPVYVERLQGFLEKSAREAKLNTSWTDQDPGYVQALRQFVAGILQDPEAAAFRADFEPFQRQLARVAVWHSLSQTLLKLTVPGIPDIYQGCELWDFSLVDPDNRRPVDYSQRRTLLEQIQHDLSSGLSRRELVRKLLEEAPSGAIKLDLTWCVLNDRKAHAALYEHGTYQPLTPTGPKQDHVLAFAREHQGASRLVLATRGLGPFVSDSHPSFRLDPALWAETRIPLPDTTDPAGSVWTNLLTDQRLEPSQHDSMRVLDLSHVLADLPVALLARG